MPAGHVCEVYDKQEQRIVAIKKIHRVFEDLIDCKRILREIAILNRLNHDHIVKILDILVPNDLEKFDVCLRTTIHARRSESPRT